jgi:DNA polymerase-3 subunit epsilon
MAYRTIFFDTETTTTSPENGRIIEVAAFDSIRGTSFEELIHPGVSIPQETTAIHGITDAMVATAEGFKAVILRFLQFCDGNVALVAHNGDNFDLPFLRAEMKRAGLEIPANWIFIDSLKWARRYRPDLPRHSLQYLRQVYGIQENRAHRALNDVMVLYEVYRCMTDDLTPEQVHQLLHRQCTQEPSLPAQVTLSTTSSQQDLLMLFT